MQQRLAAPAMVVPAAPPLVPRVAVQHRLHPRVRAQRLRAVGLLASQHHLLGSPGVQLIRAAHHAA